MANDPKKFRIPKEFSLFGHRYTVHLQEDMFEKEACYGQADEDEKKIRLQKKKLVKKTIVEGDEEDKTVDVYITDETVVETFYHELFHIVFDALGEDDLSQNERLINMMGKSFLEIYLSSQYEEET